MHNLKQLPVDDRLRCIHRVLQARNVPQGAANPTCTICSVVLPTKRAPEAIEASEIEVLEAV
jgi:hypothetical protein